MARNHRSLKISDDIWDSFKHEREHGTLQDYPSDNAAIENILFYALKWRRAHSLNLSTLTLEEQDLVHAYLKYCVLNDIDDREKLPPRATAQDVLALAKRWRDEQKG